MERDRVSLRLCFAEAFEEFFSDSNIQNDY